MGFSLETITVTLKPSMGEGRSGTAGPSSPAVPGKAEQQPGSIAGLCLQVYHYLPETAVRDQHLSLMCRGTAAHLYVHICMDSHVASHALPGRFK